MLYMLSLDLGGDYMWVNYERGYTSSTYRPDLCGSAACQLLNSTLCETECFSAPAPGCYNNTCPHFPFNVVADSGTFSKFGGDVFTIQSTDRKNVLQVVTFPRLYFTCGNNFLEVGLASGVTGIVGLGRIGDSLPAQLSSYFRLDKKFDLCLSLSTRSSGVVFFGNGPYTLLPVVNASSSLTYTPLIINPVTGHGSSVGDASPNYFIGVTFININGKRVWFNETYLSIDASGYGGTTISTAAPYTLMETSIYIVVVTAFVKAMPKKVQCVPSVASFGACFSTKNISSTRLGPDVPSIDLGLQNKSVYWRIFGANSMVEVKKDVLCLGVVDAGSYYVPRFSVLIGGHQIEDNLLQFDVSRSSLGFSSSLLG